MPETLTARAVAAKILTETRKDKQFAAEALDNYPQLVNKPAATDLIMGVLRNRRLLDAVVEKVMGQPFDNIRANLRNIIRVAVFELVYCPQTADYAVVNEAVDYASKITNQKGAGFVNWILRSTQKHIINRRAGRETESVYSRKTVPQSPISCCEFDIEVLPDKNESMSAYLGAAFSLPDWLIESWLAEFGIEQTTEICFARNRRPSVYLRVNPLKTTAENLADELRAAGIDCKIEPESQMIKLIHPGAISELPGFNEGLFVVQDLSAATPVVLLNSQQGCSILDLCAAPGTKTTQLAEATEGKAKIIATDIDTSRLQKVRENVKRLGLSDCIRVIEYNALDEVFRQSGGFDCVLVDVPCSNTGVLARRPEVRHRITREAVDESAKVQQDLLSQAAGMLKQGGILCYSTCSLQSEENRLMVKRFLDNNAGFKLKAEKLNLPSADDFDHDGSYTAVLDAKNR
jgi:16S rRNA (cytosine967-C5)-methyltransferase